MSGFKMKKLFIVFIIAVGLAFGAETHSTRSTDVDAYTDWVRPKHDSRRGHTTTFHIYDPILGFFAEPPEDGSWMVGVGRMYGCDKSHCVDEDGGFGKADEHDSGTASDDRFQFTAFYDF